MDRIGLRGWLLAGIAGITAILQAPAIQAQVVLEEIVVTAQKRAQSAQDVPISLTAFSGDKLVDLGLTELSTLSDFVPGLQIQLQSPNNPGYVIRGITSDNGSAQQEARVSVFVDGVPASRARGAVVELFDIERVEVLKGPQGTLFGRGAQIGAVHIISAKPELDRMGGSGRVAIGDYGQQTYEAVVNAPLSEKAAIRLAGISRQRDGYVENLAPGTKEDLNGIGVQALRGSVLLEGSEDFTLTGIVNYQKDDYTGTSFKNNRFAPAGGSISPFEPAQLNRGDELGVDRELFNVNLTAEYRLSDSLNLTAITGYRKFDTNEEFDADGTQAYLLEFGEQAHSKQWSQELRLNYDDGDRFQGFVGASYFREKGYQLVPLRTNERSLALLTVPALAAIAGPPILPNGAVNPGVAALPNPAFPGGLMPLRTFAEAEFTNYGTNTAYDVFADGTYNITPEFSLTAGLRYTHEKQESAFEQWVDRAASLLGSQFGNVARKEREGDFDSVVGRFVASYKPAENALLYASVSRGRRPAVVQVTASASNTLKNEIVWSYEAGGKTSLLDDRVQLEGSAFYYDYSNFQTSTRPDGSPIAVVVDSGTATAYGMEAAVNVQAADWLSFFANYGYIHAEFDDTDSNGNPQNLAGNTFRLTPKHSVSLGAQFVQPLGGSGVDMFLTPTFSWKSRVYFEETNLPAISQGAYGTANLRAGLRAADGSWTVTAYAQNLFDREYLIDAGNTGGAFGLPTFIAGPPRFYGVEVSVRF
ncbi:TonB-dependent receptor [Niveispirillum irakense]|uniref:TonB-dependent receptor n=1 Tax=Niveispirillum irakense TaxID=34011 RepID=UPI000406C3D5|nr:TonB-dependent receptor [Niveispirillum irakense]